MKFVNLLILLFLILPGFAHAEWSYRGYNRLFLSAADSNTNLGLNHRSTGIYSKENLTFEVAYELLAMDSISAMPSGYFRLEDLNTVLYTFKNSQAQLTQNLDRFYLNRSMENWNVSVGRQVVSFGSARTINPIDIVLPMGFTVFQVEQRVGVDAAVVKYSSSDLNEWEAGLVFDGGKNDDVEVATDKKLTYLSYKHSFEDLDSEVVVMSMGENTLFGLDIQTGLGKYGAWAEMAWVDVDSPLGDSFYRASVGVDRMLSLEDRDLHYYLEYHYNGVGNLVDKTMFGIFLQNRDYINLGLSTTLNPLNNVSISLMNSLNDGSSLLAPSWEWNFKQDYYLSVGGFIGIDVDKGITIQPGEFASYPETVYVVIKSFL